MAVTIAQIIVWLIVGALAGSLAGFAITGKLSGLGRWMNLGLGLVGALIGGAVFRFFNIWPGLDSISISLRDVVAAFLGALVFLIILRLIQSRR